MCPRGGWEDKLRQKAPDVHFNCVSMTPVPSLRMRTPSLGPTKKQNIFFSTSYNPIKKTTTRRQGVTNPT
jgi:hypothetical protein